MQDFEDFIENLEQELDSDMMEYINDYAYDYAYRFAMGMFTRCFIEQYSFDISFEHNKEAIAESIEESKKKFNEEKDLFEEIGWDAYLESKDPDFVYMLKWSFRSNAKCDLSDWSDYYSGTYPEYIEETIERLSLVKEACEEFLYEGKHQTIEKVFNKRQKY